MLTIMVFIISGIPQHSCKKETTDTHTELLINNDYSNPLFVREVFRITGKYSNIDDVYRFTYDELDGNLLFNSY